MFRWMAALAVGSVITALLGFTGFLTVSAGIAQTLCALFLVLLGLTMVFGIIRGE